jgi:RNA polymerase sigma-70 factor (ECF subfamily)
VREAAPKQAPSADENELIRAAQSGYRAAFEQLVRVNDQGVLRLAMNLLRSPEDARDVYQETFLRVYRNLGNFRFDCSFHTWLYRIATNLCLDQLRKRKVRREEPTVLPTSEGTLDRMEAVPEERGEGDPHRRLYSGQIRGASRKR